ncbi:hypothetical protein OSB04_015875 [Centaurea solstitialis]|uniref:Uncharacterized protein n=1 Tax=Centaurea solstitialis TaxID=347529 RepID=A0AA38TBT0_9ASTR|nr:hypothetical protein OSB04_015875 [Centaurea solstitialis]
MMTKIVGTFLENWHLWFLFFQWSYGVGGQKVLVVAETFGRNRCVTRNSLHYMLVQVRYNGGAETFRRNRNRGQRLCPLPWSTAVCSKEGLPPRHPCGDDGRRAAVRAAAVKLMFRPSTTLAISVTGPDVGCGVTLSSQGFTAILGCRDRVTLGCLDVGHRTWRLVVPLESLTHSLHVCMQQVAEFTVWAHTLLIFTSLDNLQVSSLVACRIRYRGIQSNLKSRFIPLTHANRFTSIGHVHYWFDHCEFATNHFWMTIFIGVFMMTILLKAFVLLI